MLARAKSGLASSKYPTGQALWRDEATSPATVPLTHLALNQQRQYDQQHNDCHHTRWLCGFGHWWRHVDHGSAWQPFATGNSDQQHEEQQHTDYNYRLVTGTLHMNVEIGVKR